LSSLGGVSQHKGSCASVLSRARLETSRGWRPQVNPLAIRAPDVRGCQLWNRRLYRMGSRSLDHRRRLLPERTSAVNNTLKYHSLPASHHSRLFLPCPTKALPLPTPSRGFWVGPTSPAGASPSIPNSLSTSEGSRLLDLLLTISPSMSSASPATPSRQFSFSFLQRCGTSMLNATQIPLNRRSDGMILLSLLTRCSLVSQRGRSSFSGDMSAIPRSVSPHR